MQKPLVSFIIPVYNSEGTLRECVDSVLIQIFNDFELLLINDGSQDASGDICDAYAEKDSRVRVFHKENGGVSSARNLGLDYVRGKYIAFCDSDDWVDEAYLSSFVCNIDESIDLLVSGFNYIKDGKCQKSIIFNGEIVKQNVSSALDTLHQNQALGYLWNKLFKREIVIDNAITFNVEYQIHEDEVFVLQYLKSLNGGVYFVPNVASYNYNLPEAYFEKYKKAFSFGCFEKLLVLCIGLDCVNSQLYNSYCVRMAEYILLYLTKYSTNTRKQVAVFCNYIRKTERKIVFNQKKMTFLGNLSKDSTVNLWYVTFCLTYLIDMFVSFLPKSLFEKNK